MKFSVVQLGGMTSKVTFRYDVQGFSAAAFTSTRPVAELSVGNAREHGGILAFIQPLGTGPGRGSALIPFINQTDASLGRWTDESPAHKHFFGSRIQKDKKPA